MPDYDFILRVLRATSGVAAEMRWHLIDPKTGYLSDKDDGELQFVIDCSDTFAWGCSDCEQVTPENVAILEDSVRDVMALGEDMTCWISTLFCSRVRKMRPMPPVMYHYHRDTPEHTERKARIRPLLEACGPERGRDW